MSQNKKSFRVMRSRLLAASSILALTCSLASPAFADDKIVGDASTDSFTNASSTDSVTGNLILGNQFGGNGTYTITGNTALTSVIFSGAANSETPNGELIVGNGGTGSFIQGTDGTDLNNQVNVAGTVVVGSQAGSTGTYTLNSGKLNPGGDPTSNVGILVGDAGNGIFNQSGGTVTSGVINGQRGDFVVGAQAGSTGSYTLTDAGLGGPVSVNVYGDAVIGRDSANASFAAANGSLTIGSGTDNPLFKTFANADANGDMTVGDAGIGNLTVKSGSVDIAHNLNIGVNGTGTVTQSGGTVSASFVDLSTAAGVGSSSYALSGGTLTTIADLNVGGGSSGTSTFTQTGSSSEANINGALRIGNANNTASYGLTNGFLTVGADSFVGFNTLSGSMTQSGGSFTTQTLTVGGATGGTGTYTQTAGSALVFGAMTIGTTGTATVTSLHAGSIVNNNKFVLSNATVTAATVTNNGLLEGTGTITGNVTNNGTFHPGASPGTLNITGNYAQNPGGVMDFTLAGTTPGTGYSQLNVTGTVGLAGSLELTDTTFPLSTDETFALINAGGGFTGSLSSVLFNNTACTGSSGSFACIGNGQTIDFSEILNGGSVSFKVASVSAVPLPAALPLFATALAGLVGFASKRRRG